MNRYKLILIYILVFIFTSIHTSVFSQFLNKYWAFGDSAGINWLQNNNPIVVYTQANGRGSCITLGDSLGMKLFAFTRSNIAQPNTAIIFNGFNDTVIFGDSIVGEAWYHELIFIPQPENDSLVYMFSIGVTGSSLFGLYYTLINYRANNDSGLVILKNVQLNALPAFDGLTAIRHGNGRDWWLVFQRWYNPLGAGSTNDFKTYLISSSGISNPINQNIGPLHSTNGGQLFFNSTGTEIGLVTLTGLFCLYDFDRCTGLLSNPITIEAERTVAPYPYFVSGVFSPDDSKIYVMADTRDVIAGTVDTLYQYNLNATNINSSKQIIYYQANADIGSGALKLGPDGKIYLACGDEIASVPYPDSLYTQVNTNLSVINQPDSLGLACDFQPFSFYLGGARTYYGLPNNPDYELGAWVGSPCDTLSVGLPQPTTPTTPFFQAWYNHEWDMVHVNAAQLKGKKGVLRLMDIDGRIVYEKSAEIISGGYYTTEIHTNDLSNGMYIVNLVTEKDALSYKVMK